MTASTPPSDPTPAPRLRGYPRGTTLRSIAALLLREMATNNARSFGGVAWAVLQPVAAITLLTLVFSAGFRSPPLGDVFAIFYATGMLPFSMYTTTSTRLSNTVVAARKLLSFPRVTILDAIIARFVFSVMVQLAVSIVVFTGILSIWDTKTVLHLAPLAHAFAMTAGIALGVGSVNAYLFAMFPTWRNIWGIGTAPLFILSCIFFQFEAVPQPFDDWLWYNPLVHVVGMSRSAFYPGYNAEYVSPLYVWSIVSGLTILGLILINQGRSQLLTR